MSNNALKNNNLTLTSKLKSEINNEFKEYI